MFSMRKANERDQARTQLRADRDALIDGSLPRGAPAVVVSARRRLSGDVPNQRPKARLNELCSE